MMRRSTDHAIHKANRVGLVDSTRTTHLSPAPALPLSDDGRIAFSFGELEIHYRGCDICPYGRQATLNCEPFAAVILHHNRPHRSPEWLIEYQINGDPDRGGHFGYHFYVSSTGQVFQGAPLSARTNHVKGLGYRARSEIGRLAQNRNSIGISCVGAERPDGFAPTKAQVAVTIELVHAVCNAYRIPFSHVYGHGEIQTDRHPSEGASIARHIRSWSDA